LVSNPLTTVKRGLEPAYAGTVLQHPDCSGADGHDTPAFAQRMADLQRCFFWQRIPFRMEADFRNLSHPHWLKRPQPHVKSQLRDEHAAGPDPLQDLRSEVQPSGRRGD
jgi:hypothetical protein